MTTAAPSPVRLGNQADQLASLFLQALTAQRNAGHWNGMEVACIGTDADVLAVRAKGQEAEAEANRTVVAAWRAFYDFTSAVREAVAE